MTIEELRIENFRSYFGVQTLALGRGLAPGRNIVAVGGLNGAGKTTIHDAVTFGLLGHLDAFKFVKAMERKGDALKVIERELNGLLNREAFAAGGREAKVTIFLRDNNGTKFAVQRTWIFDNRGTFKREELIVTLPDEDELGAARWEDDPEQRFNDYIRNRVLPPAVARFFLFDGEEIRKIAENEPAVEVREGIDSLLNFHLLDMLATDMDEKQEKYRADTRKRSRQEEQLDGLRVDLKKLENQHRELEEEKGELFEKLDSLRDTSARLSNELKATVGASGHDPRATQDELDQTTSEIQRTRTAVQAAIEQRIIPALAGTLTRALATQLDAEDARAQWEEGKRKVEPQREKLIERLLGDAAPQPEPALVEGQTVFFRQRIRGEWDELFNPPPLGIALAYRHPYLSQEERTQVRSKCTEILRFGSVDLKQLLTELEGLERRSRELRLALERVGDSALAARLIAEKAKVDRELGEADATFDEKVRHITAVQIELKQKRKEVTDKEAELDKSGESASRGDFARRVRRTVELFKEAMRPRKRDELARHLGDMYRHLARKEDVVQKIELDERTYGPRLLDRRGNNIPLDLQSAGEREIYALSLLWALAKTSRRQLPVVIDTPLARLDSAHRGNIVKRYLPEAGQQVIILSTDTEIDREYFELIEDRIASSFRLDFDPVTERTTVTDGYFDFK